MELASSNLLEKILEKKGKNEKFNEKEALIIFSQMVSAGAYIHSNNAVLKNIKPENIMIGFDQKWKLSDYGIVKQHNS